MRNFLRFLFLLLIVAGIFTCCKKVNNTANPNFVCPANRFTTEQFSVVTSNMQYGTAVDVAGKTINLLMDVNQPSADTLAHRPLIIYLHGGGFTGGTRNNAFANKFCQAFAKRGYVAASIDYRVGIGSGTDDEVIAAQVRAVQDAKAAVRYFKQSAIEQGNPYRIDTAQIYVAGESAGAIAALQMGFLKTVADFSEIADPSILDGLNGISGASASSYSSKIAGVVSLSGAMLDLDWLSRGTLPVIMVHSNNDAATPYKMAVVAPYTAKPLYGSFSIDSAAAKTQVTVAFKTFNNAGTTPYISSSKYADSTINYVAQQLYGLIDCTRLGHR